ncbi:peptidoglycan-binding domain-containing protein [Blastococcus sp. PRF04-17]|uniref:peptidoglycan-binding domain-containing protein n=1 Tax=Blastococcus sp. PRF04-17 TaxID=2933797 RepID=UPI001FF3E7C7|nr:peptidoglycan-binding protein [Blastococcus sp. PRF04-17]UOY00570.1 peptidoglycan-binding protein [Blastococcus sp. PRF04-17]
MQILRLGDRGPAVADVRAALRSLGLLGDAASGSPGAGTGPLDTVPLRTAPVEAGPLDTHPINRSALDTAPLDTAEFDAATELAVRHFQQIRGLSVDGRVGEETYRALNEARWSLGDRLLRYDPERPIRGDDVIGLQDRLHELGYDAGPVDGVFGPETEIGLRTFQRDYGLTSDGTCGRRPCGRCASSAARSPAAVPSCCGRARPSSTAGRTSSAGGSSWIPATAATTWGTPWARPPSRIWCSTSRRASRGAWPLPARRST